MSVRSSSPTVSAFAKSFDGSRERLLWKLAPDFTRSEISEESEVGVTNRKSQSSHPFATISTEMVVQYSGNVRTATSKLVESYFLVAENRYHATFANLQLKFGAFP